MEFTRFCFMLFISWLLVWTVVRLWDRWVWVHLRSCRRRALGCRRSWGWYCLGSGIPLFWSAYTPYRYRQFRLFLWRFWVGILWRSWMVYFRGRGWTMLRFMYFRRDTSWGFLELPWWFWWCKARTYGCYFWWRWIHVIATRILFWWCWRRVSNF